MLNAMHLPAIALDKNGFAVDANAAAQAVFDENIKIKDRRLFVRDIELAKPSQASHRSVVRGAPPECFGGRARRGTPLGQITGDRADLAIRGAVASAVRTACPPDHECHRPEARAAGGNHRQDVPSDTIGSQTRLHHRARRTARYRGPRVEDFPGDGAKPVEIRVRQNPYPPAKRTRRAAFASRVTNWRPPLPRLACTQAKCAYSQPRADLKSRCAALRAERHSTRNCGLRCRRCSQ